MRRNVSASGTFPEPFTVSPKPAKAVSPSRTAAMTKPGTPDAEKGDGPGEIDRLGQEAVLGACGPRSRADRRYGKECGNGAMPPGGADHHAFPLRHNRAPTISNTGGTALWEAKTARRNKPVDICCDRPTCFAAGSRRGTPARRGSGGLSMTTDRIGALGRRGVLKGLAAGGTLAATAGFPGFIQAQTLEADRARLRAAPHRHRRRLRPLVRAHGAGGAQGAERGRRHRRPAGRDRLRGRRHRSQARRRGGRELRQPERRRGVRRALQQRRRRGRAAGGRARRCPTSSAPRATTSRAAR